jgi:rubredoxin
MKPLSKDEVILKCLSSGEQILDAIKKKQKWYIIVKCQKGHIYEPSVSNFISKNSRCPKCKAEKHSLATTTPENQILNQIKDKFKNISEITLLEKYCGLTTKAVFKCVKHGEFESRLRILSNKFGCFKCSIGAGRDYGNIYNKIKENVQKKGYVLHTPFKDKINSKTVIEVVCPSHGVFKTRWNDLSQGHGCRKCSDKNSAIKNNQSFLEFMENNYSPYRFIKRVVDNRLSYVIMECVKHGQFKTRQSHFKRGVGCYKCNKKSAPEQEIFDYIKTLDPHATARNRTIIKPLELDIYSEKYSMAFEFNGLYWHSDRFKPFKTHFNKFKACETKQIKLFAIFEDEWRDKKELVKGMIRHRLGFKGVKLRASKLQVRKMTKNIQFSWFFDKFHLDGHAQSSFAYGLFLEDRLICCASFRKHIKSGELEISRFATDYDFHVYGGLGKILKQFSNCSIISYSNNRLSSGNLYKKCGFTEITETTDPSYWYSDLKVRIFRTKFKKINSLDIVTKYPTEKKQVENGVFDHLFPKKPKKIYKIYDYGHKKWEIKL